MPTRKVALNDAGETLEVHYESEEEYKQLMKQLKETYPKAKEKVA